MTDCPLPISKYERVLMAHGSGGLLSQELVRENILPFLKNPILDQLDDGAVLPAMMNSPVVSVDAYTVKPRFFPGGVMGSLAICGSVNDVAMSGGRPLWITLSLILEEGFLIQELRQLMESLGTKAAEVGVKVVAGDTKVVRKGEVDGVFMTTTCIGEAYSRQAFYPQKPQLGDVIVVSGKLARHGVAIAAMQSLKEGDLTPAGLGSDLASLHEVAGMLHQKLHTLRLMRDPTRGGLAAVLTEWAGKTKCSFQLDEKTVPLGEEEKAFCELKGYEPLHLASEGVLVMVIAKSELPEALSILKTFSVTEGAVACGEVVALEGAEVRVKTFFGSVRFLDPPIGEIVSRIC